MKGLSLFAVAILLMGCNGSKAAANNEALIQRGAALIAKSDCVTCHKVNDVMTGPAYKDIAAKYQSTPTVINQLVDKVISGGSGVWGDVAMMPHGGIPKSDVKAMVTYILSLKDK